MIVFGIGESVIILTMLTFAVFMVLIQWLAKYINAIQITLLSNTFGLLVLIPFLPAADYGRMAAAGVPMWLLLVISGIIVHGLSNMIWNREMPKVGAANASLLMNMEPFVAMVGAALVLGSTVRATEIIGAILIIAGVTLSLYRKKAETERKDIRAVKRSPYDMVIFFCISPILHKCQWDIWTYFNTLTGILYT